MARPPVGTLPQQDSRAAVAAHVASRLAGIGTDRARRDAWLGKRLGLKLRSNGVDRAAGRAREATLPWLLVDESKLELDLQRAFLTFPGNGRRRPRLIARLKATDSVRQLMVLDRRRDVICVLLFRRSERDRVVDEVRALKEAFQWSDVVDESRELEASAWAALTVQMAQDEALG
jgi:hypothetical protein